MKHNNSIYKSVAGRNKLMAFYDDVLNKWPVTYETKIVSTRHGNTHIIISGEKHKPPLILLHGSASNATSWLGDIENYSNDFRVYAVDIVGEAGKSDENRPSWYGLDFAEWLFDTFEQLKIEKTSILGISQGAWAAIRFATVYPNLVEKLVLITPAGIMRAKMSFIRKAVFYSYLGKFGVRKLNQIVLGNQQVNPLAIKYMTLIGQHFKPRYEKEYIFKNDELGKLTMPVLFMGGEKDALQFIPLISKRLKKYTSNIKTIIFPDKGHALINLSEQIIVFLKDK